MENIPIPTEALIRARDLRSQSTHEENLVWQLLRGRRLGGVKFRRQYPLPPYTLDFYAPEIRLCVELDGLQHAENADADRQRDEYLKRSGIRTVRIGNNDVFVQLEAVLQAILNAIGEQRRLMGSSPLTRRFAPASPTGRGE